jgi:hypothetical protein
MTRARPNLLVFLVLVLLVACSSPASVRPAEDFGLKLCGDSSDVWTRDEGLVEVDGGARTPSLRTTLVLSGDASIVDGQEASDEHPLRQLLAAPLIEATEIAEKRPELQLMVSGELLLSVNGTVQVERVAEAAETAFAAGYSTLLVVVRLPTPLLEYLEPELARETLTVLSSATVEVGAERLVELMEEEAETCRAAVEVLQAVADAEPGQKCQVMSQGVATFQAECSKPTWRRLVTLLQLVGSADLMGYPVGVLETSLVPDSEPLAIEPGTRWKYVVERLRSVPGGGATLRLVEPSRSTESDAP